jgi:hypothetical protein
MSMTYDALGSEIAACLRDHWREVSKENGWNAADAANFGMHVQHVTTIVELRPGQPITIICRCRTRGGHTDVESNYVVERRAGQRQLFKETD